MTSSERDGLIAKDLTAVLFDAWLRDPSTKVGEKGKPTDIYFSIEKAVTALTPYVAALSQPSESRDGLIALVEQWRKKAGDACSVFNGPPNGSCETCYYKLNRHVYRTCADQVLAALVVREEAHEQTE